jgi:hypothetical protein
LHLKYVLDHSHADHTIPILYECLQPHIITTFHSKTQPGLNTLRAKIYLDHGTHHKIDSKKATDIANATCNGPKAVWHWFDTAAYLDVNKGTYGSVIIVASEDRHVEIMLTLVMRILV